MTALLAIEFEPGVAPQLAVNALRRPALLIRALDVGRREVIATVEVEDGEVLEAVLAALRCCRGVRASTAFAEGQAALTPTPPAARRASPPEARRAPPG